MMFKQILDNQQLLSISQDTSIPKKDIRLVEEAVLSTLFTNVLNEQDNDAVVTYVKAKYEILDNNAELIDASVTDTKEYMDYIKHCLKSYFERKGKILDGIYEIHVIFSSLTEGNEVTHIVTAPPIIKRKDLND